MAKKVKDPVMVDINKLIKPSTLARKRKVSRQDIYALISKNKIKHTLIDGVVFCVLN
jgi:hypothetical protein